MPITRRQFCQGIGATVAAAAARAVSGPALAQEAPAVAQEPLQVGSDKQLFIDELFFAEQWDVRLVVNRPIKPTEPCLVPDRDKPWEANRVSAYNSVIDDKGVVKLYYDAIAPCASDNRIRWTCYAESRDGVHFEKPKLGIVPFNDRQDTNIVFPPEWLPHEPSCVFIDTNPNCPPEERYKLVASLAPRGKEYATFMATSADGIHFKLLDAASFRASDTGNVCFYDDRIGRYVGYVRYWEGPFGRKVGRCEFDDIKQWGQETLVFSADEVDQQGLETALFTGMDFYNSAAVKYPLAQDVYLIFPAAYYHYQQEVAHRIAGKRNPGNDGPLDIQFATSRDGIQWTRHDREPFIPLGKSGGWDDGYVFMGVGIVVREEEVWLYYAASSFTHGDYALSEEGYGGSIARAVQRLDGFVSVDTDYRGGEFTTPQLVFAGKQLVLNMETSAGGHVRVELQDEQGKPIEGLTHTDCDFINGNFIRLPVSWKGNTDVSALAGRPIRMRLTMRSAKLYAFQFEA